MVYRILAGGYNDSVFVLTFDPSPPSNPSQPTLTLTSKCYTGPSPSWISKHPTRPDLAIACLEGSDGKILLLKLLLDGEDGIGRVEVVQSVSTLGADPCHFEWVEGGVVVANVSHCLPSQSVSFSSDVLIQSNPRSIQAQT